MPNSSRFYCPHLAFITTYLLFLFSQLPAHFSLDGPRSALFFPLPHSEFRIPGDSPSTFFLTSVTSLLGQRGDRPDSPPGGLNRSLPNIPPFPPLALLYPLRRSLLPPCFAFPGFFSGVGFSHLNYISTMKPISETPGCRVTV